MVDALAEHRSAAAVRGPGEEQILLDLIPVLGVPALELYRVELQIGQGPGICYAEIIPFPLGENNHSVHFLQFSFPHIVIPSSRSHLSFRGRRGIIRKNNSKKEDEVFS